MNKMDSLDRLGPIADEMLAGLHADNQMKMRIREAAVSGREARRPAVRRFAPAIACCALAIACVGALGLRGLNAAPQPAQISTIAAGESGGVAVVSETQIADLGDGARVSAAAPKNTSLFAERAGDMPLVTVDGAVYRMLTSPKTLGDALRGGSVGSIAQAMEQPSLASGEALRAGVSNVAAQGAQVYSVKGVSSGTLVAVEVDGQVRVFQRVSYAGKGPGKQSLEDTFDVRGKVKTLELSGVGTLSGQAANAAIAVLLDNATLKSADMSARKQSLTVTLESGLKLQLGVSGDTLCGCGGWSCPEFFDAFKAAL